MFTVLETLRGNVLDRTQSSCPSTAHSILPHPRTNRTHPPLRGAVKMETIETLALNIWSGIGSIQREMMVTETCQFLRGIVVDPKGDSG